MRWIRLLFRIFGWLLTPLLAWAASFFGAVAGAIFALRMHDPVRGLITMAACGGLAGFLTVIAWLRYLRRSPQVREALAVTEDGTPDTTELGSIILMVLALGAAATPRAEAQTLAGQVGRFYVDGGWTRYRIGVTTLDTRTIDLQLYADAFQRVSGAPGHLTGLGLDAVAFGSGHDGPYAVAGIGGGLGSAAERHTYTDVWSSWSLGGGYRIFPLPFLSTGIEGRWRGLSLGGQSGFELAVGVGLHFGGGHNRPAPRAAPAAPGVPVPGTPAPGVDAPGVAVAPAAGSVAALADSIIATATAMLGRPYEYGGRGDDSSGFDCSGLIQYAFGAHGITLPRRSEDQARMGRAVPKRPDELRPGDLLTFSNRGGPITHVGLYLGDGRFVHSATHGVQVSLLREDDPYGRWWYKRWVGVRRLID